MSWNFCPWCGHRVYQHGDKGCQHITQVNRPCSDPQCGDSTWDHDCDADYIRTPCDCTKPYDRMEIHR